jgi:hypothetical protein
MTRQLSSRFGAGRNDPRPAEEVSQHVGVALRCIGGETPEVDLELARDGTRSIERTELEL